MEEQTDTGKKLFVTAALILLLVALSFICIDSLKILRPDDESLYVQIAREMFARHDIWAPIWCGEYAFYKPPFVYWLIMLGFTAFGSSFLAARIPIVTVSIATIFLTYCLGRELHSRKAGLLAAAMTATSLGFVIYGKIAMMDIPLTFLITLAVFFFQRAVKEQSTPYVYLFCLASGLSTLVKGPISLVIILLFALSYVIITKEAAFFLRLSLLPAWLFLALLAGLWPIALYCKGLYQQWFDFFIIRENFGKFSDLHYPGFLMIQSFLIYLFPWSPLLVASLWILVKKKLYRNKAILLFLLWMLAVLVVHLFPATKLKHYVIPAIPAGALLIAAAIELYPKERACMLGKAVVQILAAAAILFLAAMLRLTHDAGAICLILIAVCSLVVTFIYSGRGKDYLTAVAGYGCALLFIYPALNAFTYERLPGEALTLLKDNPVAVVRLQTYVYTADAGRYTPQIINHVDFNRFLYNHGIVLISESDLESFKAVRSFRLAPVRILYRWRQWKPRMPLSDIIASLNSGSCERLTEELYLVKEDRQ